jgi:hypothetical protein
VSTEFTRTATADGDAKHERTSCSPSSAQEGAVALNPGGTLAKSMLLTPLVNAWNGLLLLIARAGLAVLDCNEDCLVKLRVTGTATKPQATLVQARIAKDLQGRKPPRIL